jgi:hypothetical protein
MRAADECGANGDGSGLVPHGLPPDSLSRNTPDYKQVRPRSTTEFDSSLGPANQIIKRIFMSYLKDESISSENLLDMMSSIEA